MLSPAAQHRTSITAKPEVQPSAANTPYDTLIIQKFRIDQNRVKAIRSRKRRCELKRSALSSYQPWVADFMKATGYTGEQASMFVWLLLWNIDVGNWQAGYDMAVFAIGKGMASPVDFSRTLAETVTEQMVDGINQASQQADNRLLLESLYQMAKPLDMTDQITAKLYKAYGLACIGSDNDKARHLLEEALKLNEHSGVKRVLSRLGGCLDSRVDRRKKDYSKVYSLSASQAAKRLGFSAPTVIRHAKKYPDKLPHLSIPMGKRTVYRFNVADIKRYKTKHLVSSHEN